MIELIAELIILSCTFGIIALIGYLLLQIKRSQIKSAGVKVGLALSMLVFLGVGSWLGLAVWYLLFTGILALKKEI